MTPRAGATGTTTSRWCAPSPTMSTTTTRTSQVVAATAPTTRLPTTVPTVTPTLVAMTTDSPASPRSARPRRPGVSVRARITAALAALALVALTAAGLIVYVIERARIDEAVSRQVEQEIAEFEKLRDGKDPATNEPFTNVEALLRLYLSRNVPSDEELLVGWLDNGHRLVSSEDELARSPAFLAAVRRLLDTGGTERDHLGRSGAPVHRAARPEPDRPAAHSSSRSTWTRCTRS